MRRERTSDKDMLKVLAVVVIAVAVIAYKLVGRDGGEEHAEHAPAAPAAAAAPPAEDRRDPARRFTYDSGREHELEAAAMDAVLAFCSETAPRLWRRKVTQLGATFVLPSKQEPDRTMVNVSAKLDDPSTEGHTLYYAIRFAGETPSTIRPVKEISGKLCGLDEDGATL